MYCTAYQSYSLDSSGSPRQKHASAEVYTLPCRYESGDGSAPSSWQPETHIPRRRRVRAHAAIHHRRQSLQVPVTRCAVVPCDHVRSIPRRRAPCPRLHFAHFRSERAVPWREFAAHRLLYDEDDSAVWDDCCTARADDRWAAVFGEIVFAPDACRGTYRLVWRRGWGTVSLSLLLFSLSI